MAKLYFVGDRIFYDDEDETKIFFLNGYVVYSFVDAGEPPADNSVPWMSWF